MKNFGLLTSLVSVSTIAIVMLLLTEDRYSNILTWRILLVAAGIIAIASGLGLVTVRLRKRSERTR